MLKISNLKAGKEPLYLAEVYDVNGRLLASNTFDTDIEAMDWFSALSASLIAGFRQPIVRL